MACVVAVVGGHTAEMLNLLSVLQKESFSPRFYVAAATDNMSLQKARTLENSLADEVYSDRLLRALVFFSPTVLCVILESSFFRHFSIGCIISCIVILCWIC